VANTAQARKRARQNDVRRQRNTSGRSKSRSAVKDFLKSVGAGDRAAAQSAYRDATSSIDRAVAKGLHGKNRAARLKQRMNNRLRGMAQA